jgi:hypothetical protein
MACPGVKPDPRTVAWSMGIAVVGMEGKKKCEK